MTRVISVLMMSAVLIAAVAPAFYTVAVLA